MSRAAPVPSRGGGRVRPTTLTMARGQARRPKNGNPSSTKQQAIDRRRLAPAYSARTRAVPYTANPSVPRDTYGRMPGVVAQGVSMRP